MKTKACPECTANRTINRYSETGAIYSIHITHQPDCPAYAARQATAKTLANQ